MRSGVLGDVLFAVLQSWLLPSSVPHNLCHVPTSTVFICLCLGRDQLKCDDTRAENGFRLSAKRTSPFKSAGWRQFSRILAAEVCPSAVVMLDTPCSEVV